MEIDSVRVNLGGFRQSLTSEGEPIINKINELIQLIIRWCRVRLTGGAPALKRLNALLR